MGAPSGFQQAPIQQMVAQAYIQTKSWGQSVVEWFVAHLGYNMVALMILAGIPFLIYYRKHIWGLFNRGKVL